LPVLLGEVTFFHSVPDAPDLNLTACLLVRARRNFKDSSIDAYLLTTVERFRPHHLAFYRERSSPSRSRSGTIPTSCRSTRV
jgi:hypothetical protein